MLERPLLLAVGLGSNVDPADRSPFRGEASDGRLRALEGALRGLAAFGWPVLAASALHECAAVGGPAGQPDFLNACVLVAAPDRLEAVREASARLELAAGRRSKGHGLPRPLDIDLLNAWRLDEGSSRTWTPVPASTSPGLSMPHPRLRERAFVLVPLAEILPLAPPAPEALRESLRPGPASAAFPQPWQVPAGFSEALATADPALLSFDE